jgi:hypothetical protein
MFYSYFRIWIGPVLAKAAEWTYKSICRRRCIGIENTTSVIYFTTDFAFHLLVAMEVRGATSADASSTV